jgi:hypothetical protein
MTPQQYQAVITLMGAVMFWLVVCYMHARV